VTDQPDTGRVLLVVVCGAGPAGEVGELVKLAQERGWRVGVVATPAALEFLDVPALEHLTGNPVRSQYRRPDEVRTRSLPDPEAIVVAPGTYNTICKLAAGVSDTYALGVLAEAIGRGVSVVILPFVNTALASRRPFVAAVESLRGEGVRVLLGPGQWEPHPPGTGGGRIATFPWRIALEAIES
jgi:phosphopantothenoylcysteine synthetase/decarboxylase